MTDEKMAAVRQDLNSWEAELAAILTGKSGTPSGIAPAVVVFGNS